MVLEFCFMINLSLKKADVSPISLTITNDAAAEISAMPSANRNVRFFFVMLVFIEN